MLMMMPGGTDGGPFLGQPYKCICSWPWLAISRTRPAAGGRKWYGLGASCGHAANDPMAVSVLRRRSVQYFRGLAVFPPRMPLGIMSAVGRSAKGIIRSAYGKPLSFPKKSLYTELGLLSSSRWLDGIVVSTMQTANGPLYQRLIVFFHSRPLCISLKEPRAACRL